MLSKFLVLTPVITKSDKITSLDLFESFLKNLLQNVTNIKNFTSFKTVITKCERYYKVAQNL